MPLWLEAGFWGVFAGSALLLGAVVGYWVRLPQKSVAGVMAFGGGVLISALSFELTEEAYHQAGLIPTAIGLIGGALIYCGAVLKGIWFPQRLRWLGGRGLDFRPRRRGLSAQDTKASAAR